MVLRRPSGFIEPCQPSKGIPATFQQSEQYGCQKEAAPVSGDWGRGGLDTVVLVPNHLSPWTHRLEDGKLPKLPWIKCHAGIVGASKATALI